jgi:hypothetical protein
MTTIIINKKEYDVRLGLGVFIKMEAKHNTPFQNLIQSGQLRYLIEVLFEGIRSGEKKAGLRRFSFETMEDLADELTTDMAVITETLPKLLESVFPSAEEGDNSKNTLPQPESTPIK